MYVLFTERLVNLTYSYLSYCNLRRWTPKYPTMAYFRLSPFHRFRIDYPSDGSCNFTHLFHNNYRPHAVTHRSFACSVRLFWLSYLLLHVICLFVTAIARYNLNLAALVNLNFRSFTAVSILNHTTHDITCVPVDVFTKNPFHHLAHHQYCSPSPPFPLTRSLVHEILPIFLPHHF